MTVVVLYAAAFDASRNLTTGTPANTLFIAPFVAEYSPLTEFLNGVTDRLFASILLNSSPNMGSFNINSFPTGLSSTAKEGSGTSGIVVDNVCTASFQHLFRYSRCKHCG